MPNNHVTNLLDGERLGGLSSADLAAIETHAPDCAGCLEAWEAARVSAALLQARSAESVLPSVFFAARTAAALRERRLALQPSTLLKLWKSTGIMVAAMLAAIVILLTLTLSDRRPTRITETGDLSVDQVVLEEPNQAGDESQGIAQDLDSLFDSEEGYGPN